MHLVGFEAKRMRPSSVRRHRVWLGGAVSQYHNCNASLPGALKHSAGFMAHMIEPAKFTSGRMNWKSCCEMAPAPLKSWQSQSWSSAPAESPATSTHLSGEAAQGSGCVRSCSSCVSMTPLAGSTLVQCRPTAAAAARRAGRLWPRGRAAIGGGAAPLLVLLAWVRL